jgi:hypothetical protein
MAVREAGVDRKFSLRIASDLLCVWGLSWQVRPRVHINVNVHARQSSKSCGRGCKPSTPLLHPCPVQNSHRSRACHPIAMLY